VNQSNTAAVARRLAEEVTNNWRAESQRLARERVIKCVAADYVISQAAAEQLLIELFGGGG
jgi:hypothetical protein